MEINRTYNHKTFGEIGAVTFTVPKGSFKLNGHELPESSVSHLMTFALQTLQDAYAGAKSTDEAKGAFNGKYDKLLNGSIGTRGSGDGADERTRVARSLVHTSAMAKLGKDSDDWKKFLALTESEQNAKLDLWYEIHAAEFDPEIDAEIARRAAKRAAKEKLKAAVTFTM